MTSATPVTTVHHAFTSPNPEWIDKFEEDPATLAYAYDIVCNGNELWRFNPYPPSRRSERVFNVMGIGPKKQEKFSSCWMPSVRCSSARRYRVWRDRIGALLTKSASIRDVIAFPKSGGGYDPLTEAPAPITPEQRAETGVDYDPEEDSEETDA